MNNENNNNSYSGQVLGNVNNNLGNMQPETLETLDTNNSAMPINNTMNSNMNNNVNSGINNNIDNQVNNNSYMANNVNMGNVNNTGMVNNETMMQTPPVNNSNMQNPTTGTYTPPVTPEPAYTNPQTISPMPGFENQGTIGTTPPISFEPEKQPKKKGSNKTLFVIIVIVLLFGVGFGTYYVLNYTDLLSSKPKVEITTKDIDINLGDTLSDDINNYASVIGTDIKNCSLELLEVNVNAEGTYNYQVTCGEVVKKGTINVKDNRELDIEVQKVYKVKGDTIEPQEFISNLDSNYTYEFVNKEEVENYLNGEIGTYQIKINVTSGTKTKEVDAELVILQYKIIGYLTCKSKEQTLTNSSTKKIVKEEFALAGDGDFGFGKVANEIYEFKFADETEYSNYVAKYKTDNTITIDNITGTAKFDDENLTITLTNSVSESELITKYGESNITNYRSIKKYFIDTLGYECSYKKEETQN